MNFLSYLKNRPLKVFLCLGILGVMFACGEKAPKVNPREVLLSKLQGASELATVEFVLNKVVMGKKETSYLGFSFGTADFLAETQARVKAGIDLAKIRPEDITILDQQIKLRLPPVEMLNFSFPSEEFKVNEEYTRNSYWSEMTQADIDELYRKAENAIKADLQWLGVEAAAEKKTRAFLQQFLRKFGYEQVSIEFRSRSASEDQLKLSP